MNVTALLTRTVVVAWKQRSRMMSAWKWVRERTATDLSCVMIIFVIALCLRLPLLDHPSQTEFDEVIYANFISHMIDGEPALDIHPPFVRILFAEIARMNEPFITRTFPIEPIQPFGDFPYVPLRIFVAICGVLLPLILYATARIVGQTPRVSGFISSFVLFDPAFTVYSRAILPDTVMLVCALLAVAAAFRATRTQNRRDEVLSVVISAIAIGLAVSTKWTMLAVLATIILLYFLTKKYYAIFLAVGMSMLLYVGIFIFSLSYYPNGGSVAYIIPAYNVPMITETRFPDTEATLEEKTVFFFKWHKIMLDANTDTIITDRIFQAPGPLSWPIAKASIIFWVDEMGHTIVPMGNQLLYVTTFFLFLFECLWIAFALAQKHKWPIGRNESVLLAGYLMNYLPFFLIERPMYFYHYFMAALFLFLLVPFIVPRVTRCMELLTRDRLFVKTFIRTLFALIILNFLTMIPSTLGI